MARQAAERSRGVELPGRTVDYVDDMQDAVNISVRAGADEAGTLPSLTRESGVNLTGAMNSAGLCPGNDAEPAIWLVLEGTRATAWACSRLAACPIAHFVGPGPVA